MLLAEGIGPGRIVQAIRLHLPLFLVVLSLALGVTGIGVFVSGPFSAPVP